MATNSEKSLSELEREAESTRADLVHTVDSLQSRVSPQAIKEDLKEYARETGHQLLHNLERRARENPLQAVAVGAGLAYPLWRLLGSIPAPILLVGAGIALSQRNSASSPMGSAMARSAEGLTDTLKQGANDVSAKVSNTADAIKNKVARAADDAKSKVETFGARAADMIGDTTNAAREMASDAATAASDTLASTYRGGVDMATEATQQVGETLSRTKDSLIETIENHPLLVGGVGLLIGALIASSIPVTQAENRAFGETSDELKGRARKVASEGVEVAKGAAEELYEGAVSQAKQRGLTADVARDTVRDVGEKVKTVVQKATDTLDDKAPKGGSASTMTNS